MPDRRFKIAVVQFAASAPASTSWLRRASEIHQPDRAIALFRSAAALKRSFQEQVSRKPESEVEIFVWSSCKNNEFHNDIVLSARYKRACFEHRSTVFENRFVRRALGVKGSGECPP
jgi:hypothetical protein